MPIHLIVQYCSHPLPARVAEYDECMRRNLANPHIAAVHNLVEANTVVPDEFKTHPKYREKIVGRWLTYKDAFDYGNANLAGEICCLSNLDIFLDPASPWDGTRKILDDNCVLCQLCIEFDPSAPPRKDPLFDAVAFANSQDAWLFKPPIEVQNCDFEVGILGCDNAIAHRIFNSGKQPVNVADRFRIFHYDRVRGKTANNQNEIHKSEADRRPQRHPEHEGYYFVPNIDQMKSLDATAVLLKLTPMQRYQVICSMLAQHAGLENA